MPPPNSERGVSQQDDYDPDRRALVRNISVLLGVAGTVPGLLACTRPSGNAPGGSAEILGAQTTQGVIEQALSRIQEFDPSGRDPKILWTGEIPYKGGNYSFLNTNRNLVFEVPSGEIYLVDTLTGGDAGKFPEGSKIIAFDDSAIFYWFEGQLIAFDEQSKREKYRLPFLEIPDDKSYYSRSKDFLGVIIPGSNEANLVRISKNNGRELSRRPIYPKNYVYFNTFGRDENEVLFEERREDVFRVASLDFSSMGIKWSRDLPFGWRSHYPYPNGVWIMEEGTANKFLALDSINGNLMAMLDGYFEQINGDIMVFTSPNRDKYQAADLRSGRPLNWEEPARNATLRLGEVYNRNRIPKNWYWLDIGRDPGVHAYDAQTLTPVWSTKEFGVSGQNVVEFEGDVAVCAATLKGDSRRYYVLGFNMSSGEIKWKREFNGPYDLSDYFGFASYRSGGQRFFCHPKTGEVLKTLPSKEFNNGSIFDNLVIESFSDEKKGTREITVMGV